jgi:hypothetical protein
MSDEFRSLVKRMTLTEQPPTTFSVLALVFPGPRDRQQKQRIGGCWSHECSGDEIFDFSTQPLPRRECAVKSAVASTPHTGHWCNHDQTTGFDP